MINENTPQYFTPNAKGESMAVYQTIIDGKEELRTSQIRARTNQEPLTFVPPLAVDGIPGIPYEAGTSNPDIFYQGEDIVYDLLLIHDGVPVTPADFDIRVVVKPSVRASAVSFEATMDKGVYTISDSPGSYELWIPSTITELLLAGTYYLQVQIVERVGDGKGRYDRKYVLLSRYFSIAYGNFSPNVESANNQQVALRALVESTWPNRPNTIGDPKVVGG